MGSLPHTTRSGMTEHTAEQLIGRLLQLGVLLATVLVLVGGGKLEKERGSSTPDYSVFRGTEASIRNLGSIVRDASAGRARSIVQLGLIVLIATPIARVAFMLFVFAFQRDRLYVALSALVLLLLLYAFFSPAA
jgi:uncharacterized membrane protein